MSDKDKEFFFFENINNIKLSKMVELNLKLIFDEITLLLL